VDLSNIAKVQGAAGSKEAIADAKRRKPLNVVVPDLRTF